MKKLSEYRDEEALDLLADILDPITEIIGDKELMNTFRKKSRMEGVSYMIKNHKKALIRCMAAMEGVPLKDYHCNIVSLPKDVLEILNDKELLAFFKSQSQQMEEESSGSATENGKEEA